MFRGTQHLSMHLSPVNLAINLFIYTSHNRHAIASDNVEPQRYFFTGNLFFDWPYNALDGFLEDEIHAAVA